MISNLNIALFGSGAYYIFVFFGLLWGKCCIDHMLKNNLKKEGFLVIIQVFLTLLYVSIK